MNMEYSVENLPELFIQSVRSSYRLETLLRCATELLFCVSLAQQLHKLEDSRSQVTSEGTKGKASKQGYKKEQVSSGEQGTHAETTADVQKELLPRRKYMDRDQIRHLLSCVYEDVCKLEELTQKKLSGKESDKPVELCNFRIVRFYYQEDRVEQFHFGEPTTPIWFSTEEKVDQQQKSARHGPALAKEVQKISHYRSGYDAL